MSAYLAGLALGFALILPIGAQNAYVLNHGLVTGLPRSLVVAAVAAGCDSALVVAGAAGASAFLVSAPGVHDALVAGGVAFLVVLGLRSLAGPAAAGVDDGPPAPAGARRLAAGAVAVSLLNPHAILDTVGVIGGVVSSRAPGERVAFAAGTASASWVWFAVLASVPAVAGARLSTRARRGVERATGVVMLAFAVLLARDLVARHLAA